MSNFIIGETIENTCSDDGKGTCCANCQYLCDGESWKACSDSCFSDVKIKEISCQKCKHEYKSKFEKGVEKCKTCTYINICDHDLTQGDCNQVTITLGGGEISVSDYLKTLVKNEIKRSKGNEVSDKKS